MAQAKKLTKKVETKKVEKKVAVKSVKKVAEKKPAKKVEAKKVEKKAVEKKVVAKPVVKAIEKRVEVKPALKTIEKKVETKVVAQAPVKTNGADEKPNTKIVNIVISTSLEHKIPLERLIMDLPNTEYNPEQFPGLIMKIREPRASFLIFSSGKIVCTGTKSLEEVELAIERLIEYMKKVDIHIKIKPKIRVENVVASSDINMRLDLNEIAIKLTNVEYEPEQFPGLVFKIGDETGATFLIFGNGKIVCTGTKSDKDVHIAIKNLMVVLKKNGIKNYK